VVAWQQCPDEARRKLSDGAPAQRPEKSGKPSKDRYAAHLIYRTSRGEMVRSKSELLIAEKLCTLGINYQYERPLDGVTRQGRLRPDFSFVDDAGNVIVWEHLGRMDRADYRNGWEWKRQWYAQNGFTEGHNLFRPRRLKSAIWTQWNASLKALARP
jgi:hypothetical protein